MTVLKFSFNILRVATALLLTFGGVFLLLACISFNPNDPSFNLASDTPVTNWMMAPGAYIAAPLLGLLGLANIIWLALSFWGARWVSSRQRPPHLWLKIPMLVLALVSGAMMASILDNIFSLPITWPSSSFGGYVGNILQQRAGLYLHPLWWSMMVLPLFLVSSYLAFGVDWRRWLLWYYTVRHWAEYVVMRKIIRQWILRQQQVKNTIIEKPRMKPLAKVERKVKTEKKSTTKPETKQKQLTLLDTNMDGFDLPPLSLLEPAPKHRGNDISDSSLQQNAQMLERTLDDFGVKGKIVEASPGPVVTLYALEPSPGTKSSRVIGLADDISRSMSALSARIAVIPGRNAIGIELPNSTRETVYLRELFETEEFISNKMALPLALGKDISGESVVIDMARTPHLLVAGTTGSGKSVGVNAMILSLLYRFRPDECKFIMIDPKMLELSIYQDIPHLLAPVVTEPGKAVVALKWVVREMESRYRLMSNLNVRNIQGYNEKLRKAQQSGESLSRTVQTGFDPSTGQPIMETVPLDMQPIPYIVVIVDEMADLMLVAGKDIEGSIQRLAQMARAAGIHIILATQRPSVDVITGVIKANFPSRISFQVTSKIDSRTILGEQGGEQLLGMGDMLYMSGGNRITRVHGPFVSDKEVEAVVKFLKKQGQPSYIEDVTLDVDSDGIPSEFGGGGSGDDLYDQAVAIVLRDRKASTSYIQRMLKIGYNRAATLMDKMEKEGVVGAANHVGKREILVGE